MVVYGKDVRKVFKTGDSLAITLPAEYVKALGVKEGDAFELIFDKEVHMRRISPEEIKRYFERRGRDV